MSEDQQKPVEADMYSLVIYQNDQFVDGLHHAMYGGRIETVEDTSSKSGSKSGELNLDVSANIPFVTNAGVEGGGSVDRSHESSRTRTMTFAQSYFLHRVRSKLHQAGVLKTFANKSDFDELKFGDFVEFRAVFENNDLINALDMVSPDLGGFLSLSRYSESHEEIGDLIAQVQLALGRSIVESLQKEFRNETTSEYYGRITSDNGVTPNVGAAVICDKNFFANADSDRILDGEFRVIGKVIAKSTSGVSKFDRNKLLKRIKPEGKAAVTEALSKMDKVSDYIDTKVEFDFGSNVLKVIPIAIYV